MISLNFSCEPEDLSRLLAALAALPTNADDRDTPIFNEIAEVDARLSARVNHHAELLTKHDSELETLLGHDHTHGSLPHSELLLSSLTPGSATPDSEEAIHLKEITYAETR